MPAQFNISAADPHVVSQLQGHFGLPHFIATTMASRGITTVEKAERFLSPSLERDWLDPYLIPQIDKVADALEAAVREHKHIVVYGDFDGALFAEAARHGKVAVDVQCLLRHVEADRTMAFHDWAEKKQYLPVIDYLKTDAAEAEILTGLTDRAEAAKLLHSWGAKEVLITHNTEVLAYDGVTTYTCPIKARNLSGRTGRGDTTFAGYISERQRAGVEEALRYCTALVSLKMETPGPFQGTRQDVLDYIREFY